MLSLPNVKIDEPVIVSYDYDYKWIVEIPVISLNDTHGFEYEFSWNHFGPMSDNMGMGFDTKKEAVIVGKEVANALGLRIKIYPAREQKEAEKISEKEQNNKKYHKKDKFITVNLSQYQVDQIKFKAACKNNEKDHIALENALDIFLSL